MHNETCDVGRLQVHLPQEQVYFREGNGIEASLKVEFRDAKLKLV